MPAATGRAPNAEKPQEDGGWPFSRQPPRFDDQGSAHRQFQGVHSASGTNFSGTIDGHDLPMPDFTEFAPNATFAYANPPDGADHIIYANPLIALDFANFAQGSNAQSMMDMNLGFNGLD
ncbi:hypothetical protein ANO14919_134880 [Xylariales sp. No.14919]|nr:hypothetical protein ANO14919_134880 [Xylariales sp. No.14919]